MKKKTLADFASRKPRWGTPGPESPGCGRITDAGLAHLTGIHTLDMYGCEITDAGLVHLTGIHTLWMFCCDPATIAAARALRLPFLN